MADDVSVIFSAQIGQLIDGVAEVKESILSIGETLSSVQDALGEFGEAFVAAFAVEKVAGFFEHFAELGQQTAVAASLLGVSTEQISGLDIAAKASGSGLDGMVHSMERLGASLASAEGGSLKARAGLEALGISVKDFQALSPQAQLGELADKFSVLKDGIDKDAIAMAIMGRAGAQMIPIFNQGKEGLQDFFDIAERAGTAMSKEVTEGFEATHRSLLELGASFEGVGISVASIFKPAFDGIVKILIDVVQGFNNSIREGGTMKVMLEALAAAAKLVATALATAIGTIETLWTVGKAVVEALANDFRDLGSIIYGAMTFDMSGIKSAWSDLMNSNHQVAVDAANNMTSVEKNLMSELRTIWSSGADERVEIEQTKQARLKIANKDEVSAALSAAQEEIKIADEKYSQAAERINAEAKLGEISERQKTQALLAALEERHNAEMVALAEESEVGNLSAAQYQKILNDQEQMDQKYASDRQKIMDQAAEQEVKAWKSAADQIAGAFNSQLRGLLAGTTTFGQAMKNIGTDLVTKLIQDADKWAIEWIANQLRVAVMGNALKATDLSTTATTEAAKTAAVTTGVGARTAAETTGATTGVLAQIGNAFAVITADAAKTFAGIFAFLAPTMGPAAVGPATAGAASVETSAAGLGVPGLAVGTDMVLSGGLAYLHSGEQVVPATTSGPFTGSNGNGGMGVTFQVSAMDAASVQRFFKQNGLQIARVLQGVRAYNPSMA